MQILGSLVIRNPSDVIITIDGSRFSVTEIQEEPKVVTVRGRKINVTGFFGGNKYRGEMKDELFSVSIDISAYGNHLGYCESHKVIVSGAVIVKDNLSFRMESWKIHGGPDLWPLIEGQVYFANYRPYCISEDGSQGSNF